MNNLYAKLAILILNGFLEHKQEIEELEATITELGFPSLVQAWWVPNHDEPIWETNQSNDTL